MKKVFKKILIVIGLFLLIYLIFSTLNIKGVWIGTSLKFPESSFSTNNESVLVFDSFSAYEISRFESIDSIHKRFYLKFGDYLFYKRLDGELENTEIKINLSNDSLTFKTFHDNFKINYYRLPDSLKSESTDNIELTNKFFEINIENNTDSVFFGEKIMIRKKFNDYQNKISWDYDGYWKIVNVNGFKIFLGDFNPIVVKPEKDKIKFYYYYNNSFREFELKEFNGDKNEINKIIDNFDKTD